MSPGESHSLVVESPDISWWLHALICHGGSVPTGVVTLSLMCVLMALCPLLLMCSRPLCVHDPFPVSLSLPHVSLSPAPSEAKVPEVLGLCPAGCPRVPQGVAVSRRMFAWLLLAVSVCARPSTGRDMLQHPTKACDTPRHPMTPQDTLCPLILGLLLLPFGSVPPNFGSFPSWFVFFLSILGPFSLFWIPSPYFGYPPFAFGIFLGASPSSNPLPSP